MGLLPKFKILPIISVIPFCLEAEYKANDRINLINKSINNLSQAIRTALSQFISFLDALGLTK